MISLLFAHCQSNSSASPLVLVLQHFLSLSVSPPLLPPQSRCIYLPPSPQYCPSQQPEEAFGNTDSIISVSYSTWSIRKDSLGAKSVISYVLFQGEKGLAILEFLEIQTYVLYPFKNEIMLYTSHVLLKISLRYFHVATFFFSPSFFNCHLYIMWLNHFPADLHLGCLQFTNNAVMSRIQHQRRLQSQRIY